MTHPRRTRIRPTGKEKPPVPRPGGRRQREGRVSRAAWPAEDRALRAVLRRLARR
jgi:hypothetical protein